MFQELFFLGDSRSNYPYMRWWSKPDPKKKSSTAPTSNYWKCLLSTDVSNQREISPIETLSNFFPMRIVTEQVSDEFYETWDCSGKTILK